jgi:hypothetical protein
MMIFNSREVAFRPDMEGRLRSPGLILICWPMLGLVMAQTRGAVFRPYRARPQLAPLFVRQAKGWGC